MVPELLRALTLLASSAAALALFVIELRVKSTTSFVASNDFGGHARNLVIGQILGVGSATSRSSW